MTDPVNPTHKPPAASIQSDSSGGIGGLSASAIALLNYTEALQEYLEEQTPDSKADRGSDESAQSLARHESALHALGSITALLISVRSGTPVDSTTFKQVLNEAHLRF